MSYQVGRGRRTVLLAALVLGAVFTTVSCMGTAPVSAPGPGPVPRPRPTPTLVQPPAPPATTTSTYAYQPLAAQTQVDAGPEGDYTSVLHTSFMMAGGETLRVTDQLDVSLQPDTVAEIDNRVACYDENGSELNDASSGTNYTSGGHAYQWNVSMLITAPALAPEQAYYCQIQVYTNNGNDFGYHMSVLAPTPDETTYGTCAYSEQTSGGQVSLTERYDISNAQHHRPLYFHVTAPVSQTCGGSRQFGIDLHILWTAGNPVKIDGGNVNVINSVRETTTTVPDVTGDTQAQADTAIAAAGLTPASVYTITTTPASTVLSQNSPGGTVEPDGSTVQITVSLGVDTVPSVVGDNASTAEQVISNAHLTYSTSDINDCVDPGTVFSQDPPAGTQVAPGSQVNIQIATCNNGGGGGPTIQPK